MKRPHQRFEPRAPVLDALMLGAGAYITLLNWNILNNVDLDAEFDSQTWANREDEGRLLVAHTGELLYRLRLSA